MALNLPILRYKLPIKKELFITYDVSLELYENRQASADDLEAGGILLGSIYDGFIQIEVISIPGGNDIRKHDYFQRDRERAQRFINQAHKYSRGITNYLGEWHTHYQENPRPSPLDLSEIQQTFKKSSLPLKCVLTIIVGNGDFIGDLWVGFQNINGLEVCPRLIDL